MKAVVLTAYGDVDKLEVRELPKPRVEPDGVLVRTAGASVNPIDWKMRSGAAKDRFPVEFPAVLGRDTSGRVVEIGKEVRAFAVGDAVLGLVNGAYAELVAAPASCWAKVPSGMDLEEAGALPLVLLTGAQLIEENVRPAAGSTVLVLGALGGVGRTAVFAARKLGARVWAGVRGSQRADAAKLGADGVVALDDDADIAKLPKLDGIADTVGHGEVQKLYDKLAPGGVIGSAVGPPAGAAERGFVVRAFMAHPDGAMLARYAAAVAEGALAIPIAKRLPLDAAGEAQEIAEKKHPGGKVLLVSG